VRSPDERAVSVLALLLLAPWVGEFLLGNISMRRLPALMILALLYGCGALLIREVTRRTRRGWLTILLLGAAYGIIEAGIVEIRGTAEPHFRGGESINPRFPNFKPEFVRVRPHRIVSWGLETEGFTPLARTVN
jgi:hypothetical protein